MRIPRQAFVIVGAAAVLAAVALAGTSIATGGGNSAVYAVGDSTPDPTADPTTDPCLQQGAIETGGDLVMAAQQPCVTVTEETAPKTHTPTPEGTSEPTSPPATQPATTSTTAPPAATNTPTGGNEGAEVQPPSTGSNGNAGASSANWLVIAAGLALAIGGTSALGFGLRKN